MLVGYTVERVREAAIAPGDVFALYADPASWIDWGHNATWARSNGPLVEGGTVDVRAAYGKVYPCRIVRLVPDRTLRLEVRPPLLRITNVYEVEPTAGGSRIRHALEIGGPLAWPTRLIGLGYLYGRSLGDEVDKVVAMAAKRGGGG